MSVAPDPEAAANAALDAVRDSQWQGVPALVLRSPPGAGKTGVAQRVALQSASYLQQRCMVVTQTNEQAFDLTRRLAENARGMPVYMFATKSLALPDDFVARRGLCRSTGSATCRKAPPSPSATPRSGRGSKIRPHVRHADRRRGLPAARLQVPADLQPRPARRADRRPGQIDPFVDGEIERWRCDPSGPQVACPLALVKRHRRRSSSPCRSRAG